MMLFLSKEIQPETFTVTQFHTRALQEMQLEVKDEDAPLVYVVLPCFLD